MISAASSFGPALTGHLFPMRSQQTVTRAWPKGSAAVALLVAVAALIFFSMQLPEGTAPRVGSGPRDGATQVVHR